MARHRNLRPAGFDDLGLRRALGDRLLPMLVAAMAFLATLALGGAVAASALAEHWRHGAAAALTVQVPRPGEANRLDRVLAVLRAAPGIASARALGDGELADLLRPWLGADVDRVALPLPAVVAVQAAGDGPDLAPLAASLSGAAPGTVIESQGGWARRLTILALSLQGCAVLALLVVAAVSAAVIAVATRGGLIARREAIEIVHGLGATDGYIAGRFARRATALAAVGGACGAVLALPALLALARIAAPFSDGLAADTAPGFVIGWMRGWAAGFPDWVAAALGALAALPASLWLALPGLPLAAAAIGFVTAEVTVRRWLRRLP